MDKFVIRKPHRLQDLSSTQNKSSYWPLETGTEPGFIPGGGGGAKLKTENKNYENKN